MTQKVEPLYRTFQDIDGQPLESGYIYVGTATLPAKTNQITIYSDAALTTALTQPVRTAGGYAMNAGSPTNIYTAADDFSIDISNKNNTTVYSSGVNSNDYFNIGLTSSVSRTVSSKLGETISVKDFGAVGDGIVDDTVAIQAALDSGVGIITAPYGQYRLTAKITVPAHTLFRGANWLPDPSNGAQSSAVSLYIDWGDGADNHAVEMSQSSGIEGFTFYYPDQVAKSEATPVTFGYSISTAVGGGIADNISIKNITLYNSYKGIRIENGARFRIDNIQGDPLFIGIYADQCLDACYISNVHFWPFYTQSDALEDWVLNNGKAFIFDRVDQLFGSKLFAYSYNTSFELNSGFWGNLDNILSDLSENALVINSASTANISNFVFIPGACGCPGIVVNGTANVRITSGQVTETGSVGVQVNATSGEVIVDSVNFFNKHSALVATDNGASVSISNCIWEVPPFGDSSIVIDGAKLPSMDTAMTLPSAGGSATPITGGFEFDLSTTATTTLSFDTAGFNQRNSLFVLEMDYEQTALLASWYFRFYVQKDTGANQQVVFAPLAPLTINGTAGSPKKLRIPFFINHSVATQILIISVNATVASAGVKIKLTNLALYEQTNIKTTDAQVANMMARGYNEDAYGFGQSLMAKGKNRIVLSAPEGGRTTEAPTNGTWIVGDEMIVKEPVAGGVIGYICTTGGTPGTWKSYGAITA